MTQEEKQILLKDLCARLPYGVKVQPCSSASPHKFIGYDKGLVRIDTDQRYELDDIKPYLRPMSSMTEEEKEELVKHHIKLVFRTNNDWNDVAVDIDGFDWLNAHHLDYRGLILMGLALPDPMGMYNF